MTSVPDGLPRLSVRTVLRDVPRTVWLITALFAVLLSIHSVLTPLYRAPDEARHVSTVLSLVDGDGYPPSGKAFMEQAVLGSYLSSGYSAKLPPGSRPGVSPTRLAETRALLPLRRQDAPDLAATVPFDQVRPQEISYQLNQMTQHPPLYYLLGAGLLQLTPGDEDWRYPYVIGLLRLLSTAMIALLPLLAHAAARRVFGPGPPAVAAAAVPLAIPQLAHIGSGVSNDNLMVLTFALLTVALAHVLTGDLSRRTAVIVGLFTAAALFTKAFGLAALPFVAAAYLAVLIRTRSRRALGAGLLAGLVSMVGGWWWVANVVRYGTLQPEPVISRAFPARAGFDPSLRDYATEVATNIPVRFWGNFGYLELPVRVEFAAGATAGLVLLCIAGVLVCRPLSSGPVLLVPLLGTAAIMVVGTWGLYATYGIFPGLQGRYLFPAVPALAVLAGGGAAALGRRWAGPAVLAACLLMHLYGMRVLLRGIWQEPGISQVDAIGTMLAWSYWPQPAVLAAMALAALLGPAALLIALAEARTADPPRPPHSTRPVPVPAQPAPRSPAPPPVRTDGSRPSRGG